MAPEWRSVRVVVPPDSRQQALEALFRAGASCVVEESDALVSAFPARVSLDGLSKQLANAGAKLSATDVPDVDWMEAWKRGVTAHRVGELTVAPPWLAKGLDPAATVVIEPAMAFGTGEHATTRGALRLLERAVHRGDRVADLGAGSGVLAIAAAKLGAGRVAAIESDHDAIGNLEENVARNGVAEIVTVLEGEASVLLPLVAPVEAITANILSTVIVDLLPSMESALSRGGHAVIAGILVEERDRMCDVVRNRGWRVESEDLEAQWWSARIVR